MYNLTISAYAKMRFYLTVISNRMLQTVPVFCACILLSIAAFCQSPVADVKAVVKAGNARFTVLTPQLVRMEYDSTGKFNDAASFVVINRKLPVPAYTVTNQNGWIEIRTQKLNLRYKAGLAFNKDNLIIEYIENTGKKITWKPGDAQTQNLLGTARTLDNFDGDSSIHGKNVRLQLEQGLLARDGWSVIDDSNSFLFDDSLWPWVKQRANGLTDWYLLGYGSNYKQALFDYTLVAGKVPLPPKFAFGYWWSRYWKYSDNELRDLVQHFKDNGLPLDVLVIDMDWHRSDRWTGYTWDKSVFPDPTSLLNWIKQQDLKTTLNLHPADGIQSFEDSYAAFAKAMNFDTTGKKAVPFVASDKKMITNLFSLTLDPIKRQGVNFWWLDWQQWPKDKQVKNLDNTWWLNYIFFSHMQRTAPERPIIYHRWGGLGNHRYQIGFSGDAIISWKSLAYQPYFTTTASNVLYGYWSHDIGGHVFAPKVAHNLDPELYTRWMQYGVFSPIFRTHSAKDAKLNKEPWNFGGEFGEAIRTAINRRYQLAPYIYTMARKTYDTGISLCRPLYYDYPNDEAAYTNKSEYQFGDDILIAPVTAPRVNDKALVQVWLPQGNNWFEWDSGTLLKGGQNTERSFTLTQYPIYFKAGAVIPMNPASVKNLQKQPGKLVVGIMPGANGEGTVYEDAGNDKQYEKSFSTTKILQSTSNRVQTINIGAAKGTYQGIPVLRDWELQLYGAEVPESVLAGTRPVPWRYDGNRLSLIIDLKAVPVNKGTRVTVTYSKTQKLDLNDGLVGNLAALSRKLAKLKRDSPHKELPKGLGEAEETGRLLSYHPEKLYELIPALQNSLSKWLNTEAVK